MMCAHTHTQGTYGENVCFYPVPPVPACASDGRLFQLLVVPYERKMTAWNTKFGNRCLDLKPTRCPTLVTSVAQLQARERTRSEKLTQRLIAVVGLFSTQGQKIGRANSKFTRRSCWHLLEIAHLEKRLHTLMETKEITGCQTLCTQLQKKTTATKLAMEHKKEARKFTTQN